MGEPEGLEEADQAPEGASASESRLFPSRKGCKEPQKRETRNQGRGLSFPNLLCVLGKALTLSGSRCLSRLQWPSEESFWS